MNISPALVATERRKFVRFGTALPALITAGGGLMQSCTVLDISLGGGRIKLDDDAPVPDDFTLLFTKIGNVQRVCHVVWRHDNYLGVAFAGQFDHLP